MSLLKWGWFGIVGRNSCSPPPPLPHPTHSSLTPSFANAHTPLYSFRHVHFWGNSWRKTTAVGLTLPSSPGVAPPSALIARRPLPPLVLLVLGRVLQPRSCPLVFDTAEEAPASGSEADGATNAWDSPAAIKTMIAAARESQAAKSEVHVQFTFHDSI